MIAIYKREIKAYFQSLVGNVFIAFLVAFVGLYFMVYNLISGYTYFSYALYAGLLMLIVVIPILTMRSFSEEKRSKTDQLLLTSPVKIYQIVLGKYLAMISVLAIACLIFCLCPLIIKYLGTAHLLVDYLSILVFFLIGCFYIAVGMFLSSLTENQIIAAVSTMGVLLFFYFLSNLLSSLPTAAFSNFIGLLVILTLIAFILYLNTKNWIIGTAIEIIGALVLIIIYRIDSTKFESLFTNFLGHFVLSDLLNNLYSSSILDVAGIILLVSLSVLFFFLTIQAVQKRRWS